MSAPEIRDWSSYFTRGERSSRFLALVLATAFAAVAVTWVLATDVLLYATGRDPVLVARIETAIDWGFIAVASVVLYTVAHRGAARLNRARAILAAVVESIGDGLLIVGPDQKIVHANAAATRILDVEDRSELVGMSAEDFSRRYAVSYTNGALVPPDEFIAQRVFTEEGPLRHKVVLHPNEMDDLVVVTTASPVRSRPGQRAALVVSILHDVTDTENLEAMRDRFFASAAHSLKTPVAIIKANVQFISRCSGRAADASLRVVDRQCDRIDRLVQNLQVVSRARSHSLQLYLQPMELAPLVQRVARELSVTRGALDVRTEIIASPRVRGDRERLLTVIRNLCYEAIQAAKPGSPLTLRLAMHSAEVEVSVRYEPLPVSERVYYGVEEYDDSVLSHVATATVVEAHGGEAGEAVTDGEAKFWVRLPTLEEPNELAERRIDRR